MKTDEQKALLLELFEHAPRLNDSQRHVRFQTKFSDNDGPYRRELRMSQARIKAWCGSEHQRRLRLAGGRHTLDNARLMPKKLPLLTWMPTHIMPKPNVYYVMLIEERTTKVARVEVQYAKK